MSHPQTRTANPSTVRRRVLLPITAGLTILLVLVLGAIYIYQQQQLAERVVLDRQNVTDLFALFLEQDTNLLSGQLDFLEANETMQALYVRRVRNTLFTYAEPVFQRMRANYNITHFYFTDDRRINFLRVHNPERHSDLIVRYTMQDAFDDHRQHAGIELGTFGTFTLRVVRPWRDSTTNNVIGYLELGKEIEDLTPRIAGNTGVELIFFIDKQFLNQSDWEEGLAMTNRTGAWDQFENHVVIDSTLPTVSAEFSNILRAPENFAQFLNQEGIQYQVSRVPLIDAGNIHIGEIVLLRDISTLQADLRELTLGLVGLVLILALGLFAASYGYLGQVDTRLVASQSALIDEVTAREQQLLNGIINNIDAAIYVKDTAGRFLLANATFRQRWNLGDDITGQRAADLLPPEVAANDNTLEQQVLASGAPHQQEESITLGGSLHWLMAQRFPLIGDDNQPYAVATLTTDITLQKANAAEREVLQQQIIEAQRSAIKELSTPVIPVLDGVIIMPLVGAIDTLRAQDITRALLEGISTHAADTVIIDITGVPVVDSGVADYLNKAVKAARLKGTHTIITGISDAVAETIVDLGINWSSIDTLRNLQSGLRHAIKLQQAAVRQRQAAINGNSKQK